MISQLGSSSLGETVENCLALIERHAPGMMIAGGGRLEREILASGKKIGPERRASIVAARREGRPVMTIAREHDVSDVSVYKICQAAGLKRERADKVSARVVARWRRWRNANWPLAKIAAKSGYAECTVGVWLRRKISS